MIEKTARDIWDSRAESRVKLLKQREIKRSNTLYEDGCWRFIEPFLPAGPGRILEAGCGTGRWVYRLAPLGHRIVLSDFSPEMIRVASEEVDRRGVSDSVNACHVLDICDMHALEDEAFDMALALGEPVGLCDDQCKAVKEMHRVVRPGGYVICDVSNRYRRALDLARENDWSGAAELLNRGTSRTKSGFSHKSFSPEEVRELFTSCGLEVLHVAAVCPFLSFPPKRDQTSALEEDKTYETVRDIFHRFAEDPEMIGMSARLLIVGRKI